jgi:hypothetical protein
MHTDEREREREREKKNGRTGYCILDAGIGSKNLIK